MKLSGPGTSGSILLLINVVRQGSATFWCCRAKIKLNNWPRAISKVSTESGRKNAQKCLRTLSRQVNETVDVVLVIESLAMVRSQKLNYS